LRFSACRLKRNARASDQVIALKRFSVRPAKIRPENRRHFPTAEPADGSDSPWRRGVAKWGQVTLQENTAAPRGEAVDNRRRF
jgi:hypothetical protein